MGKAAISWVKAKRADDGHPAYSNPVADDAFVGDLSSLTNWVEWNHKLPELGVWGRRDAVAGSLRGAFDFGQRDDGDTGGGE